ncbi:MAG: glycogen synthase [bacterium]|nr:glycogen synthase [bacterium]
MKVAFVTPELQTLVRRTQLAELSEYLPKTLQQLGVDVRVFLPLTRDVETEKLTGLKDITRVRVPDVDRNTDFTILRGKLGELPIYLVDHPEFFRNRHPYGDENGPYTDNWRRYAAFTRAVLNAFDSIPFSPDIIHGVDWTTGLFPIIQQLEYAQKQGHGAAKAGTYFGIHNLAIQGSFERDILPKVGLPHRLFQAVGGFELGGKVNFLKAGAEFATIIGTHSPTQAARVQELDRGDGLEETFQRRTKELVGVLSGIDYRAWNPETDPLLAHNFSANDQDLSGKRKCKAALQASLRLDNGPRTPLLTIIGRFDSDSGFDILAEALTPMLERNIELVLMGPGQVEIIERLRTVEETFTGRCRLIEGYNVKTAHTLLAGADMLLLPSHYHSSNTLCAIGMRYGAVPIVYTNSGLEDTVINVIDNEKTGTGFHFGHYTSTSLLEGIDIARALYKKAADWKLLTLRALQEDFSWQESGRSYIKAYRRVTRRVRSKRA